MSNSAHGECVLNDAEGGSLSSATFPNKFIEMKEAVYSKRPVLKRIMEKYGSVSLYDYSKTYYEHTNLPKESLRSELINTVKNSIERVLGKAVADSAANQLAHYYHVSTADHHGPLCHPFFLTSNYLASIIPGEGTKENLKNVIALGCATVSLENSSFPRGILFNGKLSKDVQKLPFFSTHIRPSMVSHLKSYGREEIQKVWNLLQSKKKLGEVTAEEEVFLKQLLDAIYLQEEVLSLLSFSEQVTKTNFNLWKKYFDGKAAPNLIYLELEKIVTELFLAHHINKDTIINRLVFNEATRALLSKFEGLSGAFDRANKYGTFLFWGVPEGARYRLQLWNEGNMLVSPDGAYKVELTPFAVSEALRKKEIVPSLLLDFLILTCYYGLKCQGGFSQVNYLTEIRDAYVSVAKQLGKDEEAKVAENAITDEMCGDFLVAFARRPEGGLVPATGVDWLMRGQKDAWDIFVEQCKTLTLEETLNTQMPEFYKILYGENSMNEKFNGITAEIVTENTGLKNKIKPCIQI
jgi:hypothetical protein